MKTTINEDVRKVTAVQTLYHLCPLEQLELWARETKQNTNNHENKNKPRYSSCLINRGKPFAQKPLSTTLNNTAGN